MKTETSLLEIVHETLEKGDVQLPVLSPVVLNLTGMLGREDYDAEDAAQLIQQDPALASQLLKVSNSAFFAGLRKVSTVHEAIVRLGAKKVAGIVTMLAQEGNYRSKNPHAAEYMKPLWIHSVCSAMGAQWIAETSGFPGVAPEAFLAGLFHDIGELFLIKILEDLDAAGKMQLIESKPLVIEVMDTMHGELGHKLLSAWNLPDVYCEIARDVHRTDIAVPERLLSMVRLADAACHKLGIGLHSDDSIVLATLPEAGALGLNELRLAELEIAVEDATRHNAFSLD